jgi:hypothetical protein
MLTNQMKTILLTCCGLLLLPSLRAQNLAGVWKGYAAAETQGWYYGTGGYIMDIKQTAAGKYTGTAWFYETPQLYGELTVTGQRNDSADNWRFEEIKFNDLTIPKNHSARLAVMSLKLFDIDGEIVLQGSMISYSKYTGQVHTRRVLRLSKLSGAEIAALEIPGSRKTIPVTDASPAPPKPDTVPVAVRPAPVPRKNRVQGSYEISSPGIDISLYDYGTIDHDTVTVFFNGVKVADRQELTGNPLRILLTADTAQEYQELVLHANNPGDIPPNTSKMIILTSDKRYELKVTSSETENAMIRFRYIPKQK